MTFKDGLYSSLEKRMLTLLTHNLHLVKSDVLVVVGGCRNRASLGCACVCKVP